VGLLFEVGTERRARRSGPPLQHNEGFSPRRTLHSRSSHLPQPCFCWRERQSLNSAKTNRHAKLQNRKSSRGTLGTVKQPSSRKVAILRWNLWSIK